MFLFFINFFKKIITFDSKLIKTCIVRIVRIKKYFKDIFFKISPDRFLIFFIYFIFLHAFCKRHMCRNNNVILNSDYLCVDWFLNYIIINSLRYSFLKWWNMLKVEIKNYESNFKPFKKNNNKWGLISKGGSNLFRAFFLFIEGNFKCI